MSILPFGRKRARREFLTAAVMAPVTVAIAKEARSPGDTKARANANDLSPAYIYGELLGATGRTLLIEAVKNREIFREYVTYDAATEMNSVYGDDPKTFPFGSRIEVGTPLEARNPDGTRHATWVNINPIYSHGEVLAVAGDTITVQQAHGGNVRQLSVGARSKLYWNDRQAPDANVGDLSKGHHVFFTGLADNADLSCPDISLVVLTQTGTMP